MSLTMLGNLKIESKHDFNVFKMSDNYLQKYINKQIFKQDLDCFWNSKEDFVEKYRNLNLRYHLMAFMLCC